MLGGVLQGVSSRNIAGIIVSGKKKGGRETQRKGLDLKKKNIKGKNYLALKGTETRLKV